jgi:uncharacterized protein (DUF1697 family)
MGVRIALLRGVNVGGAGKLPMPAFRALLSEMGLAGVTTYIQSGNAVFTSDRPAAALEAAIRAAIADRFGFAPETFVLSAEEIAEALTDHPFQKADPARVHVFFLRKTPEPDDATLRPLALPGDVWHVGPNRLTLSTPDGIGRSRLARELERRLPQPMTARNLRTLAALHALAQAAA